MASKYPFSDGDIQSTLRNHLEKVVQEIDALETDYFLKASPVELEQHFVAKASVAPIVLHVDEYYIENQRGVKIDVSGDFRRAVFRGEHVEVQGTQVDIAIPYEGDAVLWRVRPSTFTLGGYPEISVRDDVIVMSLSFPDDSADPDRLKKDVDERIQRISKAVETLHADVTKHNEQVPRAIRDAVERKRKKATAVSGAVMRLGIPMKRQANEPAYVIPTKRKPSPVSKPKVPVEPYAPEPFLAQEEYEYILGITRRMGVAMERNPQTFARLAEEEIRDHFLLHLNGHYEGDATGETFNATGKTDILIRVNDKNVFIAECKFWRGPKSFEDAITQLLGYLSWRDSKCALLIFNRGQESTAVRQKMHDAMVTRPECRKCVKHEADGDSRYVFVKESDPGREIAIATQLFDIPSPSSCGSGG